jgi:hypothetical protein
MQSLYDRIRDHYTGNAAGSTLRLTLGCLLSEVKLRRVGSGKRFHFADDERKVSEWMACNAFVTWLETPEPWNVEAAMMRAVSLPLNLDQNRNHPFHAALSAMRREARQRARELPTVSGYSIDF